MIPSMGTCRWNVAWAGWANGAMIEERKAETETIAFWRKGWRLSKRYCTSPIRCDKQVARAFGIWLPPRMLSVKFSVLEGMAWNVQLRMLRKWFVAREDGWRGVQQNQNPLREVEAEREDCSGSASSTAVKGFWFCWTVSMWSFPRAAGLFCRCWGRWSCTWTTAIGGTVPNRLTDWISED